jgi:hypothetical protein
MVRALKSLSADNKERRLPGTTIRQLFDLACEKYLEKLVVELQDFGFGDYGPRRVRAVNPDTWKLLDRAGKKVGLTRPELLRLCLHRLLKDVTRH